MIDLYLELKELFNSKNKHLISFQRKGCFGGLSKYRENDTGTYKILEAFIKNAKNEEERDSFLYEEFVKLLNDKTSIS